MTGDDVAVCWPRTLDDVVEGLSGLFALLVHVLGETRIEGKKRIMKSADGELIDQEERHEMPTGSSARGFRGLINVGLERIPVQMAKKR